LKQAERDTAEQRADDSNCDISGYQPWVVYLHEEEKELNLS